MPYMPPYMSLRFGIVERRCDHITIKGLSSAFSFFISFLRSYFSFSSTFSSFLGFFFHFLFLLGYGKNIQSGWNINAAEFIIFIP